jgi:hypothetical protein
VCTSTPPPDHIFYYIEFEISAQLPKRCQVKAP